jgi:hypothetical protein
MDNVSEEIQPYIVYRIDGNQVECALWQLKEGQKALAFFLSGDSAISYRDSTSLGTDWRVLCPARENLVQLLKAYYQAGIEYAVLDPDLENAKRIFNIREILSTVEE